jgi:hypothetical protein
VSQFITAYLMLSGYFNVSQPTDNMNSKEH